MCQVEGAARGRERCCIRWRQFARQNSFSTDEQRIVRGCSPSDGHFLSLENEVVLFDIIFTAASWCLDCDLESADELEDQWELEEVEAAVPAALR